MTIHEALFSPARQILMAVCFLLLSGWIALIAASFRSGKKPGVRIPHLLFLVSGFLFLYLPMLVSSPALVHVVQAFLLQNCYYRHVQL